MWAKVFIVIFLYISFVESTSSEDASVTSSFKCRAGQFLCKSEKCIHEGWKCDGDNDCGDNSDELDCPTPTCNPRSEVTCNNSKCIPKKWLCDGDNDCGDRSDESSCNTTRPATCAANYFKCNDSRCLPMRWRCDGQADCTDGSDEKGCGTAKCSDDEYQCSNGNCITARWKCDGDNDCGDNSDEGASCGTKKCRSTYFRCNNGQCIPSKWKCDGDGDCVDKSDEFSCKITTKAPTTCSSEFWRCDNGNCILRSWKCDGDSDCTDGSDEKNCDRLSCPSTKLACASGRQCYLKTQKCNSVQDCNDGSDESDCDQPAPTCTSRHFNCTGGATKCIEHSKVCDNVKDCAGGEDEPTNCFINECIDHNGHCMHKCHDLKIGFKCSCNPGYYLSDDHHTCNDLNECAIYGTCHQLCLNEKGSYKCSCANGYILEANHKSCRAGDEVAPRLIFANRYDIRSFGLKGSDYKLVAGGMKGIVGLDFDYSTNYVYWTDVSHEILQRARIDKYNSTELLLRDLHTPDGLTVDWVGRKLYWTDVGLKKIEVAELDGTNNMDLLSVADHGRPRAIACDPNEGYLYWSDWGRIPGIERISMDGDLTTRTQIVSTDVIWPNGLTLDYAQNKIYWVDSKLKRIEVANMDGTGRVLLTNLKTEFPFALANFNDFLYWTDWQTNGIKMTNKFDNPGNVRSFSSNHIAPMGIKVFHPLKQPKGTNPCGSNNGGCSHLCLIARKIKDSRFSCKCPRGMFLRSDGKTCAGEPVTRKPRPSQYPHTPKVRTTVKTQTKKIGPPKSTQSTVQKMTSEDISTTPAANPCSSNNGGCSHLCLIARKIKDSRFSCKCPRGMFLRSDGKTCAGEPVTRKPRPSQYPHTPKVRKTVKTQTKKTGPPKSTQSTVQKMTSEDISTTPAVKKMSQGTNKVTKKDRSTAVPDVVNPEKATKSQDSTSASVGLVIGIALSLLVICLGIAAGIWYYRSRQQGARSIVYYKDMSTAPLEEDFDGDNEDEKLKINLEYQDV